MNYINPLVMMTNIMIFMITRAVPDLPFLTRLIASTLRLPLVNQLPGILFIPAVSENITPTAATNEITIAVIAKIHPYRGGPVMSLNSDSP